MTTNTVGFGYARSCTALDLALTAVLPENLPAYFNPLYRVLYGFALKIGRINIRGGTRKALLILGSIAGLRVLWGYIKPLALSWLTSSVTVPDENPLRQVLDQHLGKHVSGAGKRRLRLPRLPFEDGRPIYYSYVTKAVLSMQKGNDGKAAGRYKLNLGQNHHEPENQTGPKCEYAVELNLYCLGPSPRVIIELLKRLSAGIEQEITSRTDIWKHRMGSGIVHTSRPVRLMSTIDLDQDVRKKLIKDIETFMMPGRERYYADRGIQYKRGYLFHGSPGTGKTSLAMALAGMLKSAVYVVSIPSIACQEELEYVFQWPSKGDILLLEDIDSAGIVRENMTDAYGRKYRVKGLTLSGLLNVIDGGTTKEGVILIMTTNNPEALDHALIRPGRIDMQVHMGEVTQAIAQSIFLRMFRDGHASEETNSSLQKNAKLFASKFPDHKITPAEVQTFLTMHEEPEAALAAVDKWIERMLITKAAGKNIISNGTKVDKSKEQA